jgi:hypothetical protein
MGNRMGSRGRKDRRWRSGGWVLCPLFAFPFHHYGVAGYCSLSLAPVFSLSLFPPQSRAPVRFLHTATGTGEGRLLPSLFLPLITSFFYLFMGCCLTAKGGGTTRRGRSKVRINADFALELMLAVTVGVKLAIMALDSTPPSYVLQPPASRVLSLQQYFMSKCSAR